MIKAHIHGGGGSRPGNGYRALAIGIINVAAQGMCYNALERSEYIETVKYG